MFLLSKTEHALVTVYGDTPDKAIARAITASIPDKELRILTPQTPENLTQAAQNSVLVFIGIAGRAQDSDLKILKSLKENRLIACDIVAFCLNGAPEYMTMIGHGYDSSVSLADSASADFKKFLMQKIAGGSRKLSALILEEEYRRVCDALSCAPASMIIFDADKRAVFISDHYHREYPNIAPRLVRGLSVYDAFDMMAREEGLPPDDPLFEKLQRYWYGLEGSVEFTLANGTSYRLKCVQLPGRRGTVLMGQNISAFESIRAALEDQTRRLEEELKMINKAIQEETKPPRKA